MPASPLSRAGSFSAALGTSAPSHSRPTVLIVGPPTADAVRLADTLLAADARPIACVGPRSLWQDATRELESSAARLHLHDGSAAQPGLGLPYTAWRLLDDVEEIYCVAPPEEVATRHVHDFADECPRLRKLHVVSSRTAMSRRRSALGRLSTHLPAPVRTAFRALKSSITDVRAVLMAPLSSAARAARNALATDVAVSLTWEDLEQNLSPGLLHER